MKKRVYFVSVVFVVLAVFALIFQQIELHYEKRVNQKTYELPAFANMGIHIDDPHLNQKIIHEVKNSFPEDLTFLEEANTVNEYTMRDLQKLHILIGKKDTHLNSLLFLLGGMSFGEKRLYIVNGQPITDKYDNSFIGAILYKKIDGTHALEKIRRGENYWEVVEIKEIKRLKNR